MHGHTLPWNHGHFQRTKYTHQGWWHQDRSGEWYAWSPRFDAYVPVDFIDD